MQQKLKWEQRQRLTLLEATVFWSGGITTRALMEYFGISRIQASKDLTLYQQLCPENIFYDKYLKRYVIQKSFKPAFMQGDAREFLQILRIQQSGADGAVVTLAKNLPDVAVIDPVLRQIDPGILQTVNQAIVLRQEITILYQSMSRSEPAQYQISPHTLVFDGLRWHVRAYSRGHEQFRDFVLARMLRAEKTGDSAIGRERDQAWQVFLTVEIGPHPGLSAAQKRVIEYDYGMEQGVLQCQVRALLLPYFLKTMRIDRDDLQREANIQQIVLLNRDALQAYIQF